MNSRHAIQTVLLTMCWLVPVCAFAESEPSPRAIQIAAMKGDLSAVKQLVAGDPGLVQSTTKSGASPLHAAAIGDQSEVIAFLLEAGADINAGDNKKTTPLHVAASRSHMNAVEILLDGGANPNAKSASGATALHEFLSTRRSREAAKTKHAANRIITLLLDRGAKIEARDSHGITPLQLASRFASVESVGLLLQRGADIMATDDQRNTSLHAAAAMGRSDIIDLLLTAGADIEAANTKGNTALHETAKHFRAQACERLLAAGAKVDARNAAGLTALQVAAAAGPKVKEVDKLLAKVADALLNGGADAKQVDSSGRTPYETAVKHGHKLMAARLQDAD